MWYVRSSLLRSVYPPSAAPHRNLRLLHSTCLARDGGWSTWCLIALDTCREYT